MSKDKEVHQKTDFPEFQNPFKNPKWWENDSPPNGEANLGEIKNELVDEMDLRLKLKAGIVELKPTITKPEKKPAKKEIKRTWQPDPSWHAPLPKLSELNIVDEVENILDESSHKPSFDFLPFLAHDCHRFWPEFQTILNSMANTAQNLDLIGDYYEIGESIYDRTAWNFFKGIWGDFGVTILLAYLCKLDDYLVIHSDKLTLNLESLLYDHELIEAILPLAGSISNPKSKKAKPIRLKIDTYEGGDEYWVDVDPFAEFGQFPDWENQFSIENLTPLIPIHSLNLSVPIKKFIENTKAKFKTSLRFELFNSKEPPILVKSKRCNYSCSTGLTADQIVAFIHIFQASSVMHSF